MIVVHGRDGAASEQRTATFTGTVWADPVLPATDGVVVNTIVFAPGARTYWHRHEHGQLLQITAGEGFVCADGSDPVMVRAGDTIWTSPGERHWHGATADSTMSHIATSLGTTDWEAAVSDEDARAGEGRR